jgi:hypothetical protein
LNRGKLINIPQQPIDQFNLGSDKIIFQSSIIEKV